MDKLSGTVRTSRQELDCVRICEIRTQCNEQNRLEYSSTCLKSYLVSAMKFVVWQQRVFLQTSLASTSGVPIPAPALPAPPTPSRAPTVARPFKFVLDSSKRIAGWFGVTCTDCPSDSIWGCYVTKSCWKVVIVAIGAVFFFIAFLMAIFFLGQIDDLLKYQRQLAEYEKAYPTLAKVMIHPLKLVHKSVTRSYANWMKSMQRKFGQKAWFKFAILYPCVCCKGTWNVFQKILQPSFLFIFTVLNKIKEFIMGLGIIQKINDVVLKKTGLRPDPVGDAQRKKRLEKEAKDVAKQAKVDAREAKKQAKIDAREAKKRARDDAKQEKIDAKLEAQAEKLDAKREARQEALDAKKEAKLNALEAKQDIIEAAKAAKEAAEESRKEAEENAAKQMMGAAAQQGPGPSTPPMSPPPPPPSPTPVRMPRAMPPAMPVAPGVAPEPPRMPNQQPMGGAATQQYSAGMYGAMAEQPQYGGDPYGALAVQPQYNGNPYGAAGQPYAADLYEVAAQQYAASLYGAMAQQPQYGADPYGGYGIPAAGQAQDVQGYGAYNNPVYAAEQYGMNGNDPLYAQQGMAPGGYGQAQYGAPAAGGYSYDPNTATVQQQYYGQGYYGQ